MHVGLIGANRPDGFQENIGESLVQLGHRVSYLGSATGAHRSRLLSRAASLARTVVPAVEHRSQQRLARAAHERECDAVITVQGDLAPDTVAALRRHRIPIALWFPDHVANLGRQWMLAAPYTALFFKDPLLVQRLRDTTGLPVWYLPQACNPSRHRPLGDPGANPAVAVVGNIYPSRALVLRRLHQAGIPLVVYGSVGSAWTRDLVPDGIHQGRPVFREEKSRVFRQAAAVLNNLHTGEMDGLNLRLFEATAAGGAVLCEQRPALAELFEPETEVVPYTGFSELVDRARALAADPGLTRKIGDAASRRAHAEHTYQHRLPTLLEKLW